MDGLSEFVCEREADPVTDDVREIVADTDADWDDDDEMLNDAEIVIVELGECDIDKEAEAERDGV